MMKAYFDNGENWDRLLKIFEEWKGTPYRHLCGIKGRGADCTLFLGNIFIELGIISELKYDYYPRDWHKSTQQELVLESILRHYEDSLSPNLYIKRFQHKEIDLSGILKRGDMLTFNNPKSGTLASHHAGLYKDGGWLLNSIEHRGVCELQMGSFWTKRITNIFRIMEK